MSDSDQQELLSTPLLELHRQWGAKLVPFAGYEMPVHYVDGIMSEHLHTRENAGLFDVSHMGQVIIKGANVTTELEKIIPVDLQALPINKQTYGVLTNEQGGIIDDLIVTRWSDDEFFLVINAGCKEGDIAHMQAKLQGVEITPLPTQALVALQGPKAREVTQQLAPAAGGLTFMNGCHCEIAKQEVYITCSGYTGEDGYEISFAAASTDAVINAIMAFDAVKPIGLGARDSLRLEAGLCLYGHDLNTAISPIEASLIWSISKSRRVDGSNAGGFIGSDVILDQIANGVSRKRVGLKVLSKMPVREGAELANEAGDKIGIVTSGGFSPCLQAPIAMGYVSTENATLGTILNAQVRKKLVPVEVVKMPFVVQTYKR
ncbi:MAG: aminomethyltransferase [Pseudomonadales bacterium]|jgi:aminomethyltransferase